ncbi:MAG: Ig-like domain-containing protein [Patescibacteria group bacterium]
MLHQKGRNQAVVRTIFGGLSVSLLAAPVFVFAQDSLTTVGETAGMGGADLMTIIGRIIGVFLAMLGVIFLGLVLYAGFLWMTSKGEEQQILKAKKMLINAVIGLMITLGAYGITSFVFGMLTGHGLWNTGDGTGTEDDGGVSTERLSGSLGSGGIVDHYPERGATDVARNTKIFVTFRNAINTDGIMDADGKLNDGNVDIYPTADGEGSAFAGEEVSVSVTEDLKTFIFTPPTLGSPTDDVKYTVALSDNIKDVDGDKVLNSGGYEWFFTTGTVLDLDPPTITSVQPKAGKSYARNIVVEVNFDEPIDPTSSTGTYLASDATKQFSSIHVAGTTGDWVEGEYVMSNGYQTITFITNEVCGTNSCGDTLYCLPGGELIATTVVAATPGASAPQVDVYPANGIVDVAGNALDGNNDGTAGDNYDWSFNTTNDIELTAPTVSSISPTILGENVALDQPVTVTFSDLMMTSTLISGNLAITPNPTHELWYTVRSTEKNVSGEDVTESTMSHGVFLTSTDTTTYVYQTDISSVKNQYQNCFNPADGPGKVSAMCGTSAALPYCCNGVASAAICNFFQ